MAFAFKNAKLILNTTSTDVYTVPGSTTAVVFTICAANVATRSDVLNLEWTDASASNAPTRVALATAVPKGEAINYPKLVLEAGDKIKASCGIVNGMELTLAIMEIT